MTTNSNKEIYAKNSFDRFGDDLSELMFGYLSFRDKFRFECLSKQWQRLVFSKQYELLIGYGINFDRFYDLGVYQSIVNLNTLQLILRKCPNITTIAVYKQLENKEEVFQLILTYVHNLSKITADFNDLSESTLKEFCSKFGSNMKTIEFLSDIEINKKVLKFCPNLESLQFLYFNKFSLLFNKNHVLVNKLKKFSFNYSSDDIKRVEIFVENNKNSLESLKVHIDNNNTSEELNIIFKEFAKLSKLEFLDIKHFSFLEVDSSFVQYFRQIANNCHKLSVLDLTLNTSSSAVNYQIYLILNEFKSLEKLNIQLNTSEESKPFVLTAKMLNKCKHLISLTIHGYVYKRIRINDRFFTDIEKYLPKLKRLSFDCIDITDQTFESLSKLSELEFIGFSRKTKSKTLINESVVMKVINNCPKINRIYFDNKRTSIDLDVTQINDLRKNGISGSDVRPVVDNDDIYSSDSLGDSTGIN